MQSSKPSFQQVQADKHTVNCPSNMPGAVSTPLLWRLDSDHLIHICLSYFAHDKSPETVETVKRETFATVFFPSHTDTVVNHYMIFHIGQNLLQQCNCNKSSEERDAIYLRQGEKGKHRHQSKYIMYVMTSFPQRRNLFCRFLLAFPSWLSSQWYFGWFGSFFVLFCYIASHHPAASLTPEMMTRQKSWGPGKVPGRKKNTEQVRMFIQSRLWAVTKQGGPCPLAREGDEGAKNKRQRIKWRYELSPSS